MYKMIDGDLVSLTEDEIAEFQAAAAAIVPTLAGAQAAAVDLINQAAGMARSEFITETAGQDVVYLLKGQEGAVQGAGHRGDL
jgi:hypothetical protein